MKIYTKEILEIENDEVEDILRDLAIELGMGNDCYYSITFYTDAEDDDWTHGYLTSEKKKIVEKWLDWHSISRDKEYLIDNSW